MELILLVVGRVLLFLREVEDCHFGSVNYSMSLQDIGASSATKIVSQRTERL